MTSLPLPPLGGHYIAYCQNVINGQWYEFDDQYVTEVHETVVQNAEAYVLFYRWVPWQLSQWGVVRLKDRWVACEPGMASPCALGLCSGCLWREVEPGRF